VLKTDEVHDKFTGYHSSPVTNELWARKQPLLRAALLMFMPFINPFLYLSGQTAHYYSGWNEI